MTIDEVIENVCKKCKYYIKALGICAGEVLPVERAILRNAEGRGLCNDVKNFIIEAKEDLKKK